MAYLLSGAIVVVTFLIVLNGFLRGASKEKIDAGLSGLIILLVVAAFVLLGWRMAILSVVLAILAAVVTRPIAARLYRSLGGESGSYVGLPPRRLDPLKT